MSHIQALSRMTKAALGSTKTKTALGLSAMRNVEDSDGGVLSKLGRDFGEGIESAPEDLFEETDSIDPQDGDEDYDLQDVEDNPAKAI